MKGWRYEWAGALPRDVYAVLVDEMQRIAKENEK